MAGACTGLYNGKFHNNQTLKEYNYITYPKVETPVKIDSQLSL